MEQKSVLDQIQELLAAGYGNVKEAIQEPGKFHARALGNLRRQIEENPEEVGMNWTGGGLGGMTRPFGTKLSNVRKELSPYAIKRLERAADEIPGLERQFTEQALLSAFTGDNAKVLAAMDPRMFMRLAEHIKNPYEPAIADYMNRIRSGAGAEDVPYLRLGMSEHSRMPLISGHEGRHRNLAMQALETPKTLVRLFPEGAMREPMPRKTHEQFLNALTEKIGNPAKIIPEGRMTFNRQKSNFTETPEFNEYIKLKSKKDLYDDLTPEQEVRLLEFKKVMDQPYSVPDPERAIEIPEFFSSGGLAHLR